MDGIDGVKVDFADNQECLDLFEKVIYFLVKYCCVESKMLVGSLSVFCLLVILQKPIGLLSLLDEELHSPDANDATLANKLKQNLNGMACFKGDKGRVFGVRHFAGEVSYSSFHNT